LPETQADKSNSCHTRKETYGRGGVGNFDFLDFEAAPKNRDRQHEQAEEKRYCLETHRHRKISLTPNHEAPAAQGPSSRRFEFRELPAIRIRAEPFANSR
jgi:hypothetical protein